MPPINILVQPKESFRERYTGDIDPNRNRSQRFIQSAANPHGFRYPTIEISKEWLNTQQTTYYIHLTVSTVPRGNSFVRYIHPYPLAIEDTSVIKEPLTNSLYFPITLDDFEKGYKSLQFSKSKITQHELKTHGPLQKLDLNGPDGELLEESVDGKKMIEFYQLNYSQLRFSLATFNQQTNSPIIYAVTSVFSCVIDGDETPATANNDEISFRCSPQRGDCQGDDEILMCIPKIDKRRGFTIHFVYPSGETIPAVGPEFIDKKTLSFRTPSCRLSLTPNQPYVVIPIVVHQNNIEVARVDFTYESLNRCLSCGFLSNPMQMNLHNGVQHMLDDAEQTDEITTALGNHILEKRTETNHSNVQNFIEKARSFSAVKSEDHFTSLENAIQSGDDDLADILISQSSSLLEHMNDRGETPILLAARFNRSRLLRAILNRRPELVGQVDREENNLLHLLANVSNDKSAKTIAKVLISFDERTKVSLMNQINRSQQTPEQVAKTQNYSECINLFAMYGHAIG